MPTRTPFRGFLVSFETTFPRMIAPETKLKS